MEALVKIKLNEVHPNPNRDLNFNPYNQDKITALVASIHETGFWSNVIVRPSPSGKGYQMAYGHHRCQAAIQAGITEAEFVVRDLDENLMLKMLDLENSDVYKYCPLSLLESIKAVVNALADERIAPFEHKQMALVNAGVSTPAESGFRHAPSFIPKNAFEVGKTPTTMKTAYTVVDIAKYLGRTYKLKDGTIDASKNVRAALDALYLLEVKAIKTHDIKDLNWSALGTFVADIKARRVQVQQRRERTKEEMAEFDAQQRRIQAERKEAERIADAERTKLAKQLADARKEEDARLAKEIRDRLDEKDAAAAKQAETFKAKEAALEAKVAKTKQEEVEAKKEDAYLPIRREVERILHKLEGTTATGRAALTEEIKALARRPLHNTDRERLRQAALKAGEWYNSWAAMQFLPPKDKT